MPLTGYITALLPQKYQDLGYTLKEDGDFVYVKKGSRTMARFSASGATLEKIVEEVECLEDEEDTALKAPQGIEATLEEDEDDDEEEPLVP